MRLTPIALLALILSVVGCAQPNLDEPNVNQDALFGPTAMRIHPIFTQVRDFNNDGTPDGVEALLEFQDQFGDPTKAAGTVMFELFEYRKANPDPRGARVVNPWIGSMLTRQEQEARWNRTSRTYTFQLAYPSIQTTRNYVLTASFRSSTGERFDDRVVLPAQEEKVVPATQPATQPAQP